MFAPVLDLLHAHGDSTKSLRLSSLVPFAIRTYFVSSVRKSALPHRGQSDGRGTKSVILNSFQDLSFRKAYLTLPLSWICSTLTGEGRLTGRGPKSVILNLFQDLSFPQSIPHPSPLLLRRGYSSLYKSRRLKVFESFLSIIVRSTVTDYSLFTIHSPFDANLSLPPPSIPPL